MALQIYLSPTQAGLCWLGDGSSQLEPGIWQSASPL